MNFIKKGLQRWLVDLVLADERFQAQRTQEAGEKAQATAVGLMKEWLYGQDRG